MHVSAKAVVAEGRKKVDHKTFIGKNKSNSAKPLPSKDCNFSLYSAAILFHLIPPGRKVMKLYHLFLRLLEPLSNSFLHIPLSSYIATKWF